MGVGTVKHFISENLQVSELSLDDHKNSKKKKVPI